jgi:hypothetical protein
LMMLISLSGVPAFPPVPDMRRHVCEALLLFSFPFFFLFPDGERERDREIAFRPSLLPGRWVVREICGDDDDDVQSGNQDCISRSLSLPSREGGSGLGSVLSCLSVYLGQAKGTGSPGPHQTHTRPSHAAVRRKKKKRGSLPVASACLDNFFGQENPREQGQPFGGSFFVPK